MAAIFSTFCITVEIFSAMGASGFVDGFVVYLVAMDFPPSVTATIAAKGF